MNTQKITWMPRDIIAIVILVGGFALLALGIDGTVGTILMMIAVFYFGAETLEKRKRA